jgi:hypothetical protein
MLLRVLRRVGIGAAVVVALLLLLAVGLFVYGAAYAFISNRWILDKNDTLVLARPQGDTLFMQLDREVGVFSNPDSGRRLFNLTQRAVVYGRETLDAWTRIELFGWVWDSSFTHRDSLLVLADSLRFENFRQNANGIIIARILPGTELVPLFTSDRGTWHFCRTSGWVLSPALTGKHPGREGSEQSPVETDFTGLGGELKKRDRLKSLYYRDLLMLVVAVPAVILLLLRWRVCRRRQRRERDRASAWVSGRRIR